MQSNRIDYSLYLVTDRGLSKGRPTNEIVRSAVNGGVTCVQLREKDATTREFIEQALHIRSFLKNRNIPLIINDRLDVALAVKADGIHLGQKDMPLKMARSIVKNTMVIGISAENLEDAIAAERDGADYIGVSPIYMTSTKTDTAPALGLEGLKRISEHVKIPKVAIGGLHPTNAADVIRNGADGVAVVSSIVSADHPEHAAAQLRRIIAGARA